MSHPLTIALAGSLQVRIKECDRPGDSFGAVFAEYFSHYVNPATNWREGNYGWAIPQTLGWVAFVVGTGGAGALAGGTTTAGTVTAGSVTTYLGTQAGISAAETAAEGSLAYATGSDYNWATGFGKNMWVNTATGGIGGSFKVGGRAGAYLARQGIEIAGDTAIDVGVYGNDLGSSLAWNTVGSIGGEAVFNGLGRGLRRFHETFEISFNRGALTTFTTGVPIDFVSVGRRAPRGGTRTVYLPHRGNVHVPTDIVAQLDLDPVLQRALAREAVEAVAGPATPGTVVHHLVPLEALEDFKPLLQKAAQGGFNMNGLDNTIRLWDYDQMWRHGILTDDTVSMVMHSGNHPYYSTTAIEMLAGISSNLSAAKTADQVQEVANVLRRAVIDNSFPPIF